MTACFDYQLFRCAGCGSDDLGTVVYRAGPYPGQYRDLREFRPEVKDRLPLPKGVPEGIAKEFREGGKVSQHGLHQSSSGNVPLSSGQNAARANGYKKDKGIASHNRLMRRPRMVLSLRLVSDVPMMRLEFLEMMSFTMTGRRSQRMTSRQHATTPDGS